MDFTLEQREEERQRARVCIHLQKGGEWRPEPPWDSELKLPENLLATTVSEGTKRSKTGGGESWGEETEDEEQH